MDPTSFAALIEQHIAYAARLFREEVVEEHPALGLSSLSEVLRHFELDEVDIEELRRRSPQGLVAVAHGRPPRAFRLELLPTSEEEYLLSVRDVSRSLYRPSAWEEAGDAVLALTSGGHLYYANEAAQRLLGRPRAALLGRTLEEVAPSLWEALVALERREGTLDVPASVRLVLRQGGDVREVPTEMLVAPMVEGGEVAALLLRLRDVREEEAEGREDVLALTTAAVAHELRNPAQAVHGFLQLARVASQGEVRGWLEVALREFEGMMGTLEEFLLAAKGVRRQDVPVDLLMATREALRRVALRWPEAEGMVEVVGGPEEVLSDGAHVAIILSKLIENAVEAEGVSRVVVTIRPNAVEVRDDGYGVPEAVFGRLFEPFFTTKFQGSGLGLYLAKKLAAGIGATIEVRNDGGAVFTLRLPRRGLPLVPAGLAREPHQADVGEEGAELPEP